MKKGFKAVTAAALAVSALTPVAAFAAESTVDNGVYTSTNYYSIDAFKKLSGSAKASALTSEGAVIVIAGKVYSGNNVITLSDSKLDASAVTVDAYNAANGNKLVSGKPLGGENQTVDLKVESVSAINGKQLVVKFNEAVKRSSVIGTGGILANNLITVQRTEAAPALPAGTISNSATILSVGTTAVLSEDGKTLTVTLADNANVNGTYTVTVNGVLSATTEKPVKEFASTFTVADKVAPTVEKAEFNPSTGNFEITYSEPIETTPTVVRVNGEVITTASLSGSQKVVSFARPASANLGTTATVYVANALDGVGNASVAYNGSVVLTADASALQVASTKQQDSNTVRVVFNKSLNTASQTALTGVTGVITVLNNGAAPGALTVSKVASDSTNKTYDIKFTDGTAPHYSIYGTDKTTTNISIVFADGVLEDVFGQKLASNTQQLTLTKDLVAPKAVSAKPSADGTKIEVTFDEEISATPDATKVVLRKDGIDLTAVASATRKAASGDDAKVLVITPAAGDLVNGKVPAGTYTVRLDAAAVTDAHGNKNAASNINATVAGSSELTVTGVTTPATNQFEVVFSSGVTAATALSASNYTIDGAALPAGTDIKFKGATGADARIVVITLPAQSNNIAGQGELAVKNIQTAAGVTVTPKTAAITLTDNKSPELVSATLVSGNLVKLTFSEALTAYTETDIDNILAAFEISAGSNKFAKTPVGTGVTAATAATSTNGKDILVAVTPGDSNWATVLASSSITVKTLDNGAAGDGLTNTITDANSVALKAGTSVTLTK